MKRNFRITSGLAALVLGAAAFHQAAFADNAATGPIAASTNAPSSANVVGKPAMVYPQLSDQNTVFGGGDYGPGTATTPASAPGSSIPSRGPTDARGNPLTGVIAPQSPAGGSSGAPYTTPSGNYPGTGSSPQAGVPPPEIAPSAPTPATASAGAPSTPPSGNYRGSGSSPQPGVIPPQYQTSPPTPATASAGAPSTPPSGNYPGSGSSPQHRTVPPPLAPSPPTPGAASAGAPSTPVSGNYPGTGSSPQPGVVPPSLAPSPPTPAADSAGAVRTPPSGVTPGSGTSPQ